jgi:hypothetical protein
MFIGPRAAAFAFCAPIRLEKLRSVRCRTPISSAAFSSGTRATAQSTATLICSCVAAPDARLFVVLSLRRKVALQRRRHVPRLALKAKASK